jgi:hypothetical protein
MKKDVLKLIGKLILLGLPLYVMMALAALFPMKYMPIEFAMWQEEKDYVMTGTVNDEPDILVLGDSRAKSGIVPGLLTEGEEKKAYNIAIGGCNTIEMYYALDSYLKHHSAPEKAIVIFAPYHFCDIDNWGQTMNFNYLSTGDLFEIYLRAVQKGETSALGEHFFSDLLSCKLRLPNKYLASFYEAGQRERESENRDKYSSVRSDRGYTCFGEEEENDLPSYETHHPGFDSLGLVVLYYDMLLKRAKDAGIEVLSLQSPVNPASASAISREFRDGYRAMMEDFEKRYPDFVFEKEIPDFESSCFGDNNHLNRRGADRFTADVRDRYKEILFDE